MTAGMDELKSGIAAYVRGEPVTNEFFAHPLPFNVIPQIDVFQENGYTKVGCGVGQAPNDSVPHTNQ
jgi:aspartate-semialdehyde dehydrogenase